MRLILFIIDSCFVAYLRTNIKEVILSLRNHLSKGQVIRRNVVRPEYVDKPEENFCII